MSATVIETPTPRKGFFTDTSVCIGCKACEVACKEWNEVPDDPHGFSGTSNKLSCSGHFSGAAMTEKRITRGPQAGIPAVVCRIWARYPKTLFQTIAGS